MIHIAYVGALWAAHLRLTINKNLKKYNVGDSQECWKSPLVTYGDMNKTQSFVKVNKIMKS